MVIVIGYLLALSVLTNVVQFVAIRLSRKEERELQKHIDDVEQFATLAFGEWGKAITRETAAYRDEIAFLERQRPAARSTRTVH